jgi:hypothetical protein
MRGGPPVAKVRASLAEAGLYGKRYGTSTPLANMWSESYDDSYAPMSQFGPSSDRTRSVASREQIEGFTPIAGRNTCGSVNKRPILAGWP